MIPSRSMGFLFKSGQIILTLFWLEHRSPLIMVASWEISLLTFR